MRLSIAFTLALGLAESATAFTPSSLLSRSPASRTELYFQEEADKTKASEAEAAEAPPAPPAPTGPSQPNPIFEGIKLPVGEIPEPNPLPSVQAKIDPFFIPAARMVPQLEGSPKTQDFKDAQDLLVKTQNLSQGIPDAEAYNFFGTDDHVGNLVRFVKTNPFYATALTEHKKGWRGHGFELVAFDENDPKAVDSSATLYRKVMSSLGGAGHRVNVRFNHDLTAIDSIRVYDDTTGERVKKYTHCDEEELQKFASSAMYNLLFYSSAMHGTIHNLHFLLTAALNYCSEGFDELKQWANFYAGNIDDKYKQVSLLLINPPVNGPLLISTLLTPLVPQQTFNLMSNYALVSGPLGFGARPEEIVPMCEEMIRLWFKNPTNFMGSMMNISPEAMEEHGILTEFTKQADLIKPFASEMSEAIQSIDNDRFTIAELRTKLYLDRIGLESNVDSLDAWMQLMLITGIVHGSTISYSRTFSVPEIMRWRNFNRDEWDAGDTRIVAVGMSTIAGMEDHRHVFTSETDTPGESYAKEMADVLDKYSKKSDALKEAYKNEILKDMDEFNDYGWILSDFCPDGFDGKQLTITTYI